MCSRPSGWNWIDPVEPVEELGPEAAGAAAWSWARSSSSVAQSPRAISSEPMFEVIKIDGVAKVDGAALAVGQAAVVEHLQQQVEDLGVGLLDLVEQHHAVGLAPHGLGQLAALVVADVAGRGPDQARDRELLHVLAHVDAHDVALVVEQELGERLGQLGLADAGRAEEQERADRAVRIAEPRPRWRTAEATALDRLGLADHALVQVGPPSRAAWLARPAASWRPGSPSTC